MPVIESKTEVSPYYPLRSISFFTGILLGVRGRIFEIFYQRFKEAQSLLDVGVTSEQVAPDANFLEKMYPHKDRITAVGIEDASHLTREYPGLKFKKVEPGQKLPFEENQFNVTFSHAVIEHVVEESQRLFFLSELIRVSKNVFFTTPNKFFPIEPHTFLPLIHFLFPRLFYFLIDRKILNKFYNSSNLRLLSESDLKTLLSHFPSMTWKIEKVRIFGLVSNLVVIGEKNQNATP